MLSYTFQHRCDAPTSGKVVILRFFVAATSANNLEQFRAEALFGNPRVGTKDVFWISEQTSAESLMMSESGKQNRTHPSWNGQSIHIVNIFRHSYAAQFGDPFDV
jgi:hypothetical protein